MYNFNVAFTDQEAQLLKADKGPATWKEYLLMKAKWYINVNKNVLSKLEDGKCPECGGQIRNSIEYGEHRLLHEGESKCVVSRLVSKERQ